MDRSCAAIATCRLSPGAPSTRFTAAWLLVTAGALLIPASTIFRGGALWIALNAAAAALVGAYLCWTLAPVGRMRARWCAPGALAGLLVPAYHLLGQLRDPTGMAWMVSLGASLMLCLLPFALAKDLIGVIALGRLRGHRARRARRWLTMAAVAAGVLTLATGLWGGLRTPAVVELEVPLAGLPPELDGFRLVQLSDLHVGQTIGVGFLGRVVARTNELAPDAVVITGDLVEGWPATTSPKLRPLRRLRATEGVYFVAGNHERKWGWDRWRVELRRHGVRVLRGPDQVVALGGDGPVLLGLPSRRLADAAGRGGRPRIVLVHRLSMIDETSWRQLDGALVLAGHTHGGQIFPGQLLAGDRPLAGLHRRGRSLAYVSRGTGYFGLPLRLGAPSEITLLRLRSRPAPPASPVSSSETGS